MPFSIMQNKTSIFNDTSTDVLEQEAVICPPPCIMTLSELKTELRLSVEDAKKGKYFTIEQARKRHPLL